MAATLTKRSEVFQYRPYQLYFVGHFLSSIGNGMQFIANSWFVLELTGSAAAVALVLIFATLPGILLSPLIGVYVDRIDRKWLVVAMDVFRAITFLAIPLLWWFDLLQLWQIYLVVFLAAVGDEIYTPAANGLVREVVPVHMLLYANTTTAVALQLGNILGASLGGLIIGFSHAVIVMLINAISFLVSALLLAAIRPGYVAPTAQQFETTGMRRFRDDIVAGLRFIRRHSYIIVYYLMMMTIRFSLNVINVLLAPFSKNVLNVGAQGFGFIDASFAVGAIIGNWLMPTIARTFGTTKVMRLGMAAISVSLLTLAVAQNMWMAIMSYVLLGATFQVGVLYFTTVQGAIPSEYQGRVHATFNIFFTIASLAVYSGVGLVSELISLRWIYGFQALFVGSMALLAYLWVQRPPQADEKPTMA